MADYNHRDDAFRIFGASLSRVIASYGVTEDFFLRQRGQVEQLVALEGEFRDALVAHRHGPAVYQAFITYICDERRNILDARPYFRERKDVFTSQIAPSLKTRTGAGLYGCTINYQFVSFVWSFMALSPDEELSGLYAKITAARHQLVVLNMPLMITRARIFLKHARNHLTFMDLIQIAAEGLMSAIDKYTLPFSKAFISTVLGYSHGKLIERCSETTLHFYPGDKRKLYRANKFSAKISGEIDFDVLADTVNEKYGVCSNKCDDPCLVTHGTNAIEMADLMTASVCVSLEPFPSNGGYDMGGETGASEAMNSTWAVAPVEVQPDFQAEQNDSLNQLETAMRKLSLFERKLLRMRGVETALVSL